MFNQTIKLSFLLIFILKSNLAFSNSKQNFQYFGLNFFSSHSYHDEISGKIKWTDSFILVSESQNTRKYNLENKIFKIERTVIVDNQKIRIKDKYINKINKNIGIKSNYEIKFKGKSNFFVSGVKLKPRNKHFPLIAENPTLFGTSDVSAAGIYFEDFFSKLATFVKIKENNILSFSDKNLILKDKDVYEKNFTIYKFDKNFQYFDFIDKLRKELNVYSKLDGNFFWMDPFKNKKVISNTSILKKFLKNYDIKYILVRPWIDYSDFNFDTGEKFTRKEAKKYFLEIKKKIKSIDPNIKLIIPLQSNIIGLNKKAQNLIIKHNKIKGGFNFYDVNIDNFIKLSGLNINKDELILNRQNQILFETFWHDKKYGTKNLLEIALPLKAYQDGFLFSKLKDQINFAIDEINYDGVYIDQFNQYFISPLQKIAYNSDNSNFGKIDKDKGTIIEEYENIVLNTLNFEKQVIDYLEKKNSLTFFNTHHIIDELRHKDVIRFAEGFWYFKSEKLWKDDNLNKYASTKAFYSSYLSTPISLSLGLSRLDLKDEKKSHHDILVKNLRFCIYNGNLMYFSSQDIDKLNLLNFEKLNIFQKIYPIELTSIRKKTLIGKRKIITIEDLKLNNEIFKASKIFIFDSSGYQLKEIEDRIKYFNNYVEVNIDEEKEILVVESKLEIKN